MTRRLVAFIAVASVLATAPAGAAKAPETKTPASLKEVARGLLEKQGGAIITVKLVLKRRMVVQGQERGSSESQVEILGTVISPTGLTLVADSDSNPFGIFSSDDGPKIDIDTSDVKLLLPDGREVPARFVMRDHDLDLAFVQPEGTEDLKLPYLDLAAGGPVPAPLDDVVFLYRAAKSLNREVCIAAYPVLTVVRKPRTFVVTDRMGALSALGGPAFDAQGGLVGFVVLRRAPGAAADARLRGPLRGSFDMITPVVLTLADVKTVADQAAKAAAKTAAAQP
jgi:hypothetical protein